jgi:hypothetical protein
VGYIDRQDLVATGTYTLLFLPDTGSGGNIVVTLNSLTDVTGTLTIDGPAVTTTISVPGQDARETFSGTAAQQLTLQIGVPDPASGLSTLAQGTVFVQRPDGSTLAQQDLTSGSVQLVLPALPVSGLYTVVVDPVSVQGSLEAGACRTGGEAVYRGL